MTTTRAEQEQQLRPAQVAAMAGVDPTTARRLIRAGKLKAESCSDGTSLVRADVAEAFVVARRGECTRCGRAIREDEIRPDAGRDTNGDYDLASSCAVCGAVLSRYQPTMQVPDPDSLLYLVASLLFGHPGETLYLQQELADRAVYADHVDVHQAVRKLRNRGVAVEAEPRQAGYRFCGWSRAFTWHRRRRS